jgi:hypothetical protein
MSIGGNFREDYKVAMMANYYEQVGVVNLDPVKHNVNDRARGFCGVLQAVGSLLQPEVICYSVTRTASGASGA